MKPIIALLPLYDQDLNSAWMLTEYTRMLQDQGASVIQLSFHSTYEDLIAIDQMVDGYLFTGGQDISPTYYNEENKKCGMICDLRDTLEKNVFEIARLNHKAVLGICRGIQIINVLCGGSLYQDIPTEYDTTILHRQGKPYHQRSHQVSLIKDSPLYSLLKVDHMQVNSLHHQAIKQLGHGLKPMAVSEDGLIEAVYDEGASFLWAVQWHPEYMYDTDSLSRRIIQAFVEACQKNK